MPHLRYFRGANLNIFFLPSLHWIVCKGSVYIGMLKALDGGTFTAAVLQAESGPGLNAVIKWRPVSGRLQSSSRLD